MDRRTFLKQCVSATGAAVMAAPVWQAAGAGQEDERPNVVFIMADDMGYGDPTCLNPDSKIPTPHMDRLAREGMIFTDAHSGSAVCTPTRYGVVTGRYCWRTRLTSGVLNGYSRALIEPGRMTVASLLQGHGYRTGCVGKWHLGLTDREPADYSKPLTPGPNEVGFDYWFGIPASLDMPPYVYLENGLPTRPPTETVAASAYPAFWRGGPIGDDFQHKDVMPTITAKSIEFIDGHCRQHSDKPFFLYVPLTAPHTPWVPLEQNNQQSKAGIYGDFVTLVDWTVGQILQALDAHGIADNTLVILTSDNGSHEARIGKHNNGVSVGSPNFGHEANYIYRGQKADVWDGGHRIPFLARWPVAVAPGTRCDELICLTDLMATCAEIVGQSLPAEAGEDSISFLAHLQSKPPAGPVRQTVVHHSISGVFALRRGKWKFIDGVGSGGWSGQGDGLPGQLYDMEADPQEQNNLYSDPEHQAIVNDLKALLERYKEQGHSRPIAWR